MLAISSPTPDRLEIRARSIATVLGFVPLPVLGLIVLLRIGLGPGRLSSAAFGWTLLGLAMVVGGITMIVRAKGQTFVFHRRTGHLTIRQRGAHARTVPFAQIAEVAIVEEQRNVAPNSLGSTHNYRLELRLIYGEAIVMDPDRAATRGGYRKPATAISTFLNLPEPRLDLLREDGILWKDLQDITWLVWPAVFVVLTVIGFLHQALSH